MSSAKFSSHFRRSLSFAALLAVAAVLLLCFSASAAAPPVALGGEPPSLTESPTLPVVQVTTDPAYDIAPALVQTPDGNLLIVFVGKYGLWSSTSTDGGATWAAATQIDDSHRDDLKLARGADELPPPPPPPPPINYASNPSLARGADGTLWLGYDRNGDIWYRTSGDQGVTWTAEKQLTTDPAGDYDPVVLQAADGKLWVVWVSYRTGNADVWYKTSADSGVTWSADTRLTTSDADDYGPAVTEASAGRLVVVWSRWGELWQRSSTDGGATWSDETQIAGCCRNAPSLGRVGGVLWLAYERDGDIWYHTSTDGGDTWSDETRFTRFMGSDYSVTQATLSSSKTGFAWTSTRSGNWDIWFGIPGEREDINPPPYIESIEHRPPCNVDSKTTITFRARALDETGVASVDLIWTLDGKAQADLAMFDDGAHGDEAAGDGVWGVQHAPLSADSQITYRARATDTDGNTYLYTGQNSFQVLAPFVKTADILFVPDYGGWNTSWFRSYYTDALDALGYKYDTWDTGLRCAPDSTILGQYTNGNVIWAVPDWSYIVGDNNLRSALQSYLDAGGKLFITGQNIAEYLRPSGGADFLNNYLHATYVQRDTGLYALAGAAGDPIGDGLALNISGGDGASDQYSKDEVDPIDPAEVVFTYQGDASAMLAEPIQPKEEPPAPARGANREVAPDMPGAPLRPEGPIKPATSAPSAQAGCIGLCTAGLRVDTGTYKVVYFAFGFEAINDAARRACVMGRVLGWLNDTPSLPCLLMPENGHGIPAGQVSFTWCGVPGASSYEIEIDTVPTFDSPDLIDEPVPGISYNRTFTAANTWYWRVRALPDGGWTGAWRFSIALDVVRLTTDPADDGAPALAQAGRGKLLTVFVRDGTLWSRASTDGGATWGAETRVDGCCRYNPSLARAADETLWLAYVREGDIWYRTSGDNGVTWTAERQLTTDPNDDHDPVVFQAAGGKLWILWWSYRTGYPSLWNRTSPDGGATWSAESTLPISEGYNRQPTATVAADGRLVVVWDRWFGQLRQISSTDGGATWSAEKPIGSCSNPSLARAADGALWLACERDGDVWYRTSTDNGGTWSDETRFTRFVGGDSSVTLAGLSSGKIGFVWGSDRSGNPDIWFGIPGERDDINPPPYIESIEHRPEPNPESDDTVTFRAYVQDETGIAGVSLLWTLDGAAQTDRPMFDDGAHGDDAAGDGVWGVQHQPLPEGSQVTYRARATDTDGNSYRYPSQSFFKVLSPFVKTASILFVADAGGNDAPSDTSWFRHYYTDALDALGHRYDTWDAGLRGEPASAILNQYTGGAVIWAVPYWGYATTGYGENNSINNLHSYLDAGGKLFITGQNIAEYVGKVGGEGFLKNYLHATFVQGDTGLYALAGAAVDPVGDGLALNISGGDGANDQYSKDEVDPIAPAEVVFTYRAGDSAMLAEPTRPTVEPPASAPGAIRELAPDTSGAPLPPEAPVALAGNVGSGTAGLRVETDTYRVVYFAFGFEAINSAADRQAVMERVLNWLQLPRFRLYLPLVVAQLPTADSFWADRYWLEPGECTRLHWSVTNAQAVYLDGEGVTERETHQVCPAVTTTYVLLVVRESGTREYRLTIVVAG